MNNFFKTFWAAFLAFIAANIILGLLTMFFFIGMIAALGSSEKVTVTDGSVLTITLEEPITDSPPSSPFENIDFLNLKSRATNTIMQAVSAIESATVDSRIRGIFLNPRAGNISSANMEELRAALLRFRESGKFIISYADTYSQGQYFLCSAADSIYINPEGNLDWRGLSAQVMFYKGLLDKLGIEPVVIRHGSFKAAVEPFIMDRMSPENSLQMNTLVNSAWGALVGDVAASRGMDSALLQRHASSLAVSSAQKAGELGFVDGLLYNDQAVDVINGLLGDEPGTRIKTVPLHKYINSISTPQGTGYSKNRIQVIYADGNIVDGTSSKGTVGGHTIAEKLASSRRDDAVKAVVLRVNSPGGSALASEVMWREMELLKAEKPVVVSMGSMAASGGYYISCPADIILANRTTLTGSIGVFGLLMNMEKGLKDKLGITVDVARTNPSADIMSPFRRITESERMHIQYQVEQIYSTFVNHVASGRNMTFEQVDAIGQGRVWSGADALKIGLVDGIGGLREAINLAADRAGVASDFMVQEATEAESPWAAFLGGLSQARVRSLREEMGEFFTQYQTMVNTLKHQGIQARMPYNVVIE